jgi:hypothetical protein
VEQSRNNSREWFEEGVAPVFAALLQQPPAQLQEAAEYFASFGDISKARPSRFLLHQYNAMLKEYVARPAPDTVSLDLNLLGLAVNAATPVPLAHGLASLALALPLWSALDATGLDPTAVPRRELVQVRGEG